MSGPWAQRPALAVPPAPEGANERGWFLFVLSNRAKALSDAIIRSERLAMDREKLAPGTSRARITTAHAKWARAAEDRDAKERDFWVAVEACGLSTAPVKESLTTADWPRGCSHPNSCANHKGCCYLGCVHEGKDITKQIKRAYDLGVR